MDNASMDNEIAKLVEGQQNHQYAEIIVGAESCKPYSVHNSNLSNTYTKSRSTQIEWLHNIIVRVKFERMLTTAD